jgi:hypothetical protein
MGIWMVCVLADWRAPGPACQMAGLVWWTAGASHPPVASGRVLLFLAAAREGTASCGAGDGLSVVPVQHGRCGTAGPKRC